MEHTLVQQTNSIDRYLLNELSPEERVAFEEHMFDCPDCAMKVRDDFAMIADLKGVLAEPVYARAAAPARKPANRWRDWFRPIMLVPTFASLALLSFVGYQNLILFPSMEQSQVLETTPFVPATRGAAEQIAVQKRGAALFAVSFEVAAPKTFDGYTCEFLSDAKTTPLTIDCGKHRTAEFTLSLLLPVSKFPAGGYTMILRPASDSHAEVSRYSFAVRNESQ